MGASVTVYQSVIFLFIHLSFDATIKTYNICKGRVAF